MQWVHLTETDSVTQTLRTVVLFHAVHSVWLNGPSHDPMFLFVLWSWNQQSVNENANAQLLGDRNMQIIPSEMKYESVWHIIWIFAYLDFL